MTYSHKITFSIQGTYKILPNKTYQLLKTIYINKKRLLAGNIKAANK